MKKAFPLKVMLMTLLLFSTQMAFGQQIYLTYPANNANISSSTVTFFWGANIPNVQYYRFILKEVYPSQSANNAILSNPILFSGIEYGTSMTISNPGIIIKGKTYVWTVQGYYTETNYTIEDENDVNIRTTNLASRVFAWPGALLYDDEESPPVYSFIQLNRNRYPTDHHFIPVSQDTLYLTYFEKYNIDSADVSIHGYNVVQPAYSSDTVRSLPFDSTSTIQLLSPNYRIPVKYGYNFIKIPKSELSSNYSMKKFFIEIRNKMGDVYRSFVLFN